MGYSPPHNRMKRKASDAPNAEERRHFARVGQMPCLVCGAGSTVHHVTARIEGGRISRSHKRIVPLCPVHHQKVFDPFASDPVSVEGLGHQGFFKRHGIDLLAVADDLWAESIGL